MALTNAKQLRGTCVLTHAGILISAAANVDIKLAPEVDQSPDTEANRDPLGFMVKRRGVSIECDNLDITADMLRMLSGYNNSTAVGTGVEQIDFDESDTSLLEGETSAVGALVDGTAFSVYFKRGVAVPPGQTIRVSGKETAVTKLTFVKCHPTDGSQKSGYFRIGTVAVTPP